LVDLGGPAIVTRSPTLEPSINYPAVENRSILLLRYHVLCCNHVPDPEVQRACQRQSVGRGTFDQAAHVCTSINADLVRSLIELLLKFVN
jgi:hypothetical protein